jgi:hypothetical protein
MTPDDELHEYFTLKRIGMGDETGVDRSLIEEMFRVKLGDEGKGNLEAMRCLDKLEREGLIRQSALGFYAATDAGRSRLARRLS